MIFGGDKGLSNCHTSTSQQKSSSCGFACRVFSQVQGDTFIAANQNGGDAFAVAGPVSSLAFKPGQARVFVPFFFDT